MIVALLFESNSIRVRGARGATNPSNQFAKISAKFIP